MSWPEEAKRKMRTFLVPELKSENERLKMIWIAIVGKPLTQEKAKRAASIAASPIAMAFKKQRNTLHEEAQK